MLDEEPGRVGRRLATLPGEGHPVWTYLCGVLIAFAAIAGLSILFGLLVTRVVLHIHGASHDDEALISFLARHRSGGLTDASLVGSIIAGGVVLPIVAGVALIVAAIARHWRLAGFLILTLAVESGSYRATTLVIHRHRPEVHRLEKLPVNASYPSGHTAASIAIYGGIALLITSRIENRAARIAIWAAAALVVLFVAFARMYRGMHHPLDIAGGVVAGSRRSVRSFSSAARRTWPQSGGLDDEGRGHRACGQVVRRRAARAPARARAPGRRRPALDRGAEEPLRAEAGEARAQRRLRAALRVGRDGTVQRCVDELAGTETPLAILPAGTANLLATNLGVPQDIERAVAIGLHGERRKLDVGQFEGEHFAVMAGIGFDAAMIQQADGTLKDRFGRAAYVWTGSKNLRAKPFKAKIKVDGVPWYAGDASCILVGNVGRLFGGIEVFEDARPDDGQLDARRCQRGRRRRLDPHPRPHGGGASRALAARPGDESDEDLGEAEPQGSVRGRRRRSH